MRKQAPATLDSERFTESVELMIEDFAEMKEIVDSFGVPEFWSRPPGFETLVLTILEQQVSTSSAAMAFERIQNGLGRVSSDAVSAAGPGPLRSLGITKQKADYIVNLAVQIEKNHLVLESLADRNDREVREFLTSLRGIGQWTANVYLLSALRRPDIWLPGDLALKATVTEIFGDNGDEFLRSGSRWVPWRSTAVRLLWHKYLSRN